MSEETRAAHGAIIKRLRTKIHAKREEALDRLDGEVALRRLADPDEVPIPYREARKRLVEFGLLKGDE